MIGLTLVFHVFSAICILALVYWIIKLQGSLNFSRALLQGVSLVKHSKVTVDWPAKFFEKFCLALAVPFDWDRKKAAPCRIKSQPWVKLHLDYNILSVQLKNKSELGIKVAKSVVDKETVLTDLTESLAKSCQIHLDDNMAEQEAQGDS
ncbi:hypothetical protein [Pseudobacteriovorax antillogorgiicola]|uniref:Uncharacterized protein n=1 Tax=Pseudobacteriovorax antillogorgiicola TaxID=1513793 RepID=A0A1Y6C3F4_9BACT|nr:hypothetical protein [Pseudobacteriovorax antillogorgiicola]TCS50299.1 hypothetical protein EDD56_113117 [Pseudobacteriovorax antillogorgiicola]SMF33974.1 hypothetical protein SAMN06296036_110116 [Pseudobacteriovorax antillogorgiicola]